MGKKRRRGTRPLLNLIPALTAAAAALFYYGRYEALYLEPPAGIPPAAAASFSEGAGRGFSGLELYSSNAILFDPETGRMLYGKDADEVIYPASLTKIMTALVAIEQVGDLDIPVTLQYADYAGLYEQNAAMAGFAMGETVPFGDILYATLLPSGAEAATALARVAAGSTEKFIELMNIRAEELGMTDTHFVNVTGLHDDDHYTTVYDLSLLLSAASRNPAFMKAYGTLEYVTTPTGSHPQGLKLTSTIVPRLAQLGRERSPIIGCKTGYTLEAQMCLASIAEQDDFRLAVISVGAEGDSRSHPTQLEDAYLLYQKAHIT